MQDRERVLAVDTACSDLLAQIEAAARTLRHIDDDVVEMGGLLGTAIQHADLVGQLLLHMRELRTTLDDQRNALRIVREESRALCETLRETRAAMKALAGPQDLLKAEHAELLSEHRRLKERRDDRPAHESHKARLREHLTELHEFKARLGGEKKQG